MPHRPPPSRRGVAAVVMVVLLLVVELIVIGMVISGARDQTLMVNQAQTIQAFHAAEGGMNMAIRELMMDSDEDGDGGVGSVSDDADSENDPAIGTGRVSVSAELIGDQIVVVSTGVCGSSTRQLEATLEY